jgi:hypothetical protein
MSQGTNQIFAFLCGGQAVLGLFPIIGLLTATQLGAVSESACLPQRCRGQRPFVSAGHVKEPDLEACTNSPDRLLHTGNLMEGHVIDHGNVPTLERWGQALLYIG